MDPATQAFVMLLAIGLLLIAAEVFVPGGIIGVFGGMALVAAVVAGFFAFGPRGGFLAALLLVLFSGAVLGGWIRLFPRTPMGRKLTLKTDGRDFKSADPSSASLQGHTGRAQTSLHPAGIAVIDGRRIDVVAETGYIAAGADLRVVRVEGNRVVVREAAPS